MVPLVWGALVIYLPPKVVPAVSAHGSGMV
jgi:hypothetical protein